MILGIPCSPTSLAYGSLNRRYLAVGCGTGIYVGPATSESELFPPPPAFVDSPFTRIPAHFKLQKRHGTGGFDDIRSQGIQSPRDPRRILARLLLAGLASWATGGARGG